MCAYISIGHGKNILGCARFFSVFFLHVFQIFFIFSSFFGFHKLFLTFSLFPQKNKAKFVVSPFFKNPSHSYRCSSQQTEKNINNLFSMAFTMIIFHTLIQCKWNRRCICCERYLYLLIVLWKISNFFLFYLISFDDFKNSAQRFFPVVGVVVVKQMFFFIQYLKSIPHKSFTSVLSPLEEYSGIECFKLKL